MSTFDEKLNARKIKRPSRFLYKTLFPYMNRKIMKKCNAQIHYEIRTCADELKTPFLVLANHPSRRDPFYVAISMLPHRLTPLANRHFFHKRITGFLMKKMGAIPKRVYQSDTYALKEMLRAAKAGWPLMISPEGMNSYSGESMGIMPSIVKLVKHLKLPVVGVKIEGGFLTLAKWRQTEKPRIGRVDITVKQLFQSNDLSAMSDNEILEHISKELYYDDFEWSSQNQIEWRGGNLARNVEHAIYLCPRCESEFAIKTHGDTIECGNCGNGAVINKYYEIVPFDETCVIPKSISKWYNLQRDNLRNSIQDDDFALQDNVKLVMFNKKGYKEKVVGEGILTLTNKTLTYRHTKGESITLDIACTDLQGVVLKYNKGIYLYHQDTYYCFHLDKGNTSVKWAIAAEQICKVYSEKQR